MKYALALVTALYALLSIFAASVQIKTAEKKDAPAMMLSGGICLIGAVVLLFLTASFDWVFAITGGASISIAAYLNGKRSGNLHMSHHITRFCVTLALVIGFILL